MALRLQGAAFWDVLTFILNSVLFALVGLQLPHVVAALEERASGEVAAAAVAVSLTVVLVRILWVFPFTLGPKLVRSTGAATPAWRASRSWHGPGCAAPSRSLLRSRSRSRWRTADLLIFLTFVVILVTLVGRGPRSRR